MASGPPDALASKLFAQLVDDPQLPRPKPTESFWQLPPHPTVSEIQSSSLRPTTDYAIIGSGITGCSTAKHLLEHPSLPADASVVVFEARNVTSGATGRNGGAMTPFAGYDFLKLCEHHGKDEATKIALFGIRTLDKLHDLGDSSPEFKEASEVRRLRGVTGFHDEESFKEAQQAFTSYQQSVPDGEAGIEILTPEQAAQSYNLRNVVGAIVQNCGAFWPYRLVTRVWELLLASHASQLSIESNTPVTSISFDKEANSRFPYVLTTPRGTVRASKVIHATNGYAGHLLPKLRGTIYPMRGTMSTQKAPESFGRFGSENAWSFSYRPRVDPSKGILEPVLYYANQNPKTGDIFIGGERVPIDDFFVSDDSVINEISKENLSTVLPTLFEKGWAESERPEVRKIWSGIMAFTADHLPLVGQLPLGITERGEEGGEWIAAGYNGYGMPNCWSCGEAVARMLLGEDVSDFLPDAYRASEARLLDEEKMSPQAALKRLMAF